MTTKDKENLRDALKELCQHYYLPFTTKPYNLPSQIIVDFLTTLKETQLTIPNKNDCTDYTEKLSLFSFKCLHGMVPGFHLLTDFYKWNHEPIISYKVLTDIKEKSIKEIFKIQEEWTAFEYRKKEGFSESVIETLNSKKRRNGRIKILIKLDENISKIKVTYNRIEKIIEYIIPENQHDSWREQLALPVMEDANETFIIPIKKEEISNSNEEIEHLEKIASVNIPDIADVDFYTCDKGDHEQQFYELARRIYPVAVKHSVYINKSTALLYLFSNNTEIISEDGNEGRDVGLGGMFILIDKLIVNDLGCPITKSIINYFSRLSDSLSSRLINFHQTEQILKQAIRAAISQILARNYAHNLGAHVDNRTSIKQVKERIKDLYEIDMIV